MRTALESYEHNGEHFQRVRFELPSGRIVGINEQGWLQKIDGRDKLHQWEIGELNRAIFALAQKALTGAK